MARQHLMVFMKIWVPALCVATMVVAAVVSGFLGEPRKCVFWGLDAAITAWSAFVLS